MSHPTRRDFVKTSTGVAAGIYFMSPRAFGANDRIRVAVAGINGRGGSHVSEFGQMAGVEVAYLVDPDTRTFASKVRLLESRGAKAPMCVQDIRKVLEDKNVDVVSIATPNHWHSLMTVWACQAGKDVYVEKPMSHNVFEGRQAVQAARKFHRIVQHGTQSRSSVEYARIAEIAKSGKLGKLKISRGLCYKDGGTGHNTRGNLGFKPAAPPPSELDFNLWLGPAPQQSYHENIVHYRWHWFWDFGNGDMGNQGVHEMDKARWAIPGATLPKSVMTVGARPFVDQGQTACHQICVFDYGDTQLIFETRGLPSSAYLGEKVGNIYHFEQGTVIGSKFTPKGSDKSEPTSSLGVEAQRGPGGGHFQNFVAAVRSRKQEDLNADILEGHYSSALCHLGNISYRLGEDHAIAGNGNGRNGRPFGSNEAGQEAYERLKEHFAKECNLSLEGLKLRVGRKLMLDPKTERFIGDAQADKLLTRDYRAPFVVPVKV